MKNKLPKKYQMINNIDTIAQISLQYSRKMKRMFWESTSLTSSIKHWFERISPSILYKTDMNAL